MIKSNWWHQATLKQHVIRDSDSDWLIKHKNTAPTQKDISWLGTKCLFHHACLSVSRTWSKIRKALSFLKPYYTTHTHWTARLASHIKYCCSYKTFIYSWALSQCMYWVLTHWTTRVTQKWILLNKNAMTLLVRCDSYLYYNVLLFI